VLSVLHAGLSSGETGSGFDRISSAFHSACPALTRAVREELHVLGRVIVTEMTPTPSPSPHAVLGFLEAAYLAPLARELTAALEREAEAAVLKEENTTLSGRIRRYSGRSRATVGGLVLLLLLL